MSRLGDSFPEEHRAAYAAKALAPGHVLLLWCDFTARAKFKYVVIVAVDPEPLGLFINSRVPAFVAKRTALSACQIELSPAEYPFLDHTSYLDCRVVVDALDEKEILRQLTASPSRFVGEQTEATRAQVLRVIAAAPTVSDAHRTVITHALGPPNAPC
ncbi:MAG: hypothetical protein AB7Y46_19835, partial [Armatimonadota bacterium]